MTIKEAFHTCLNNYTNDGVLIESLWKEVESNYGSADRYYHTLAHLNSLFHELIPFKDRFSDWDAAVYAIVYHDIVYNVLKSNNEEKSAELAKNRLKKLSLSERTIARCVDMILATKTHSVSDDEVNLFTDADLSILGAEADFYKNYSEQIRKEFSIYPDLIYNPGRKKVLLHFLEMPRIFKTDVFFSKYESKARTNIRWELETLL